MSHAGTVAELYRYPVKSMGGERVASAAVDRDRLHGDRTYAVHDADGKLGSGKATRRFRRIDGLLDFHARYDGDVPVLTFPDGRDLRGDDPTMDTALAARLGLPCTLATEDAWTHLDAAPVHVITTSALRWISAQLPEVAIAVARFRPNMVVDVPGAPDEPVEDAWVGRGLRVGRVEFAVTERVERCVMTNAAQPGLAYDNRVLKTLAARHDMMLGVYAEVRTPGVVAVGDAVEPA